MDAPKRKVSDSFPNIAATTQQPQSCKVGPAPESEADPHFTLPTITLLNFQVGGKTQPRHITIKPELDGSKPPRLGNGFLGGWSSFIVRSPRPKQAGERYEPADDIHANLFPYPLQDGQFDYL
jgi:hypothetical protein